MRLVTFFMLGLRTTSKEKAQSLAQEELSKLHKHLAVFPERREQIAATGQNYFNQLPTAFLMVAALLSGFAGNLLASVVVHYVDQPPTDLSRPDLGWLCLSAVALLLVWYAVRLARNFYYYNLAMGSAYGIAAGGRLI